MRLARALALLVLVTPLAACRTVTVAQLVDEALADDKGFLLTAEAVDHAQQAYHTLADAPAGELEATRARVAALIASARERYRRARTYRINDGSRSVSARVVSVSDLSPGQTGRVQVPGTEAVLVATLRGRRELRLRGLETARGRTVITFDEEMTPHVASEFRLFLVGDAPEAELERIMQRVRAPRGEAQASADASLAAREAPAPPRESYAVPVAFCGSCGSRLASEAKFCTGCGRPVPGRDDEWLPGIYDPPDVLAGD